METVFIEILMIKKMPQNDLSSNYAHANLRVPTAPGKPGNPGKMVTVFPAWKNPGILSFLPNILEK